MLCADESEKGLYPTFDHGGSTKASMNYALNIVWTLVTRGYYISVNPSIFAGGIGSASLGVSHLGSSLMPLSPKKAAPIFAVVYID